MACERAQNQTAHAVGRSGISRLGSKTANYIGRAAGAGLGAAVGTALGTVGGAPGMVVGAVIGSVAGYKRAGKRQAARLTRAEEGRWQNSSSGKKAALTREKAMQKLDTDFSQKKTSYKAAMATAAREYEQAREKWSAAQAPATGIKGKLASTQAETAARVLGGVAAAVAQDYIIATRWGTGYNSKRVGSAAILAGTAAATSAGATKESVIDRRFRESKEGAAAYTAYQGKTTRLKLRYGQGKSAYKRKCRVTEAEYDLARTKFFEENPGPAL